MIVEKPNFFVFTGGPGVGKTTLIQHFEMLGEQVVHENARAVIRDYLETGGPGVPWIDPALQADLTAARDIADFQARLETQDRFFFDRGIMDCYGANGVAPSPTITEAIRTYRYNPTVFVFPPWREIYVTDRERRQNWAEAEATFERIMHTLPTLGYSPVVVPKGDIEARAAFVLARA